MASLIPIPLPRSGLHPLRLRLLPRQLAVPRRQLHISPRLLEFKAPSLEPIVLEKPDKFRPPSHPQRLSSRRKRMTYGRDLNEEEKEEQDTKQYPYAFPPKKSFMNWFLNNRSIHVYISIVCTHPTSAQPKMVPIISRNDLLTNFVVCPRLPSTLH
jgi:hypothetical protein